MAATRIQGVLVCAVFGATSSALNLSNKYLIMTYNFYSPFTVTPTQLLLVQCLMLLLGAEVLNQVKAHTLSIRMETLQRLCLVGVLFIAHVLFGIFAISRLNVPMCLARRFVTMRKLTTMFVYVWDLTLLGKKSDWTAGTGVTLITIGALVAGFNDLTGDTIGFCYAIIANLLTASYYQALSAVASRHQDIGALTQAHSSGLIGLPIVLVLMLSFDEVTDLAINPYASRPSFALTIGGVCVVAVANIVLANLCTTMNSPMATTVTGNIKDVVTMAIGLVAFGDVILTPLFVAGLALSTLGALIYSYSRLRVPPAPKVKEENISV